MMSGTPAHRAAGGGRNITAGTSVNTAGAVAAGASVGAAGTAGLNVISAATRSTAVKCRSRCGSRWASVAPVGGRVVAGHILGTARGPRGGGPFGGPFGGGRFGGGFDGPPFRRGHKAGRGDVRTAALSLLAEQPLHGYQIIQQIAERTGGVWRPSAGSVYPMLQQLADEGIVRMEESDGRRVFHLTEAGQAHVAERRDELAAVWDTMNDATDDGLRELRDLIAQVGVATMQVAQAGSPAQIAAARQALASTRRQLYRILAEDEATREAQPVSGATPSEL